MIFNLPSNLPFINLIDGKKVSKKQLNHMLADMSKEGSPLGVKLLLEKGVNIHADNDRALK